MLKYKYEKRGMFIKVKVYPKSKKQKIQKISDEKFEVFVKSDSKQNQANKEMLELIADFFEVEKKSVKIISGYHHPNKMLEI